MSTGYFLPPDGKPLRHAHPYVGSGPSDWHDASDVHSADMQAHNINDSWNPSSVRWGVKNANLGNALKAKLVQQAKQAHDIGAPAPTFNPQPKIEVPSTNGAIPDDLAQRLDDVEQLSTAAATTSNAAAEQADRNTAQINGYNAQLDLLKAEIRQLKDEKERTTRIEIYNRDTNKTYTLDGPKHIDFDDFFDAVQSMAPERRNFWLAGPAGAGKSYLVNQIGKALGMEDRIDGYGSILNIIQLVGYLNADGDYVSTQFYDYYVNGGVYFLDECDNSVPEAMVALNMALANAQFAFPRGKDGSGGLRKRHKNCYIFATANTVGAGADAQYNRFKQDDAFMDRFTFFPMDYDPKLERSMIHTSCHEWVEVVQKVRQAARDAKATFVISPRASERGQDLILHSKLSRRKIVDMVFGRYTRAEKWPHVGRAAEDWVARDPGSNGKTNLNKVNFNG